MLQALAEKGITRLMVEGGARVAASFVAGRPGRRNLAVARAGGDRRRTAFAALDALPLSALTESPAFKVRASETLGKDTLTIYERA